MSWLKEWRNPKTGRRWPDHCELNTEELTADELEGIRDMAMTYQGFDLLTRHEKATLLARALATIDGLASSALAAIGEARDLRSEQ